MSSPISRDVHLAQAPHERAVDAHQLLLVDLVGLVEHDADLVVVAAQRVDDLAHLVADVLSGGRGGWEEPLGKTIGWESVGSRSFNQLRLEFVGLSLAGLA